MRFCNRCQKSKPNSGFSNDKSTKDGLRFWCKVCCAEVRKADYDKQREEGTWVFSSVKARSRALEALGGICVHCGFMDDRALQIDHIFGGGKIELIDISNPQAVYRKIANGAIEGYQILCANCNWIKRVENQEVINPINPLSRTTVWCRNMRTKAIEVLGGKCEDCSFCDPRALQIDHVNGDGAEERRTSDRGTVVKNIANGETEGYQLLCANCNWIKRHENNESGGRPVSILLS